MPDEDLPVRLPDTVDYRGSGENPLTRDEAFLNVTCPMCGEPARRETDTMDTFIDSSWYWYPLPVAREGRRPDRPRRSSRSWTPVDQYTGGAEHAVMHLLYAREWTKMMRDVGLVEQDEPFDACSTRARSWAWTASGCRSRAATPQDPDELVATLRRGHGPAVPDVHGPVGPGRAVEPDRDRRRPPLPEPALDDRARSGRPRAGRPGQRARCRPGSRRGRRPPTIRQAAHRTLRGVTADYEAFHFNTMIAKLMELANLLMRYRGTEVAGSAEWDEAVRLAAADARPGRPAHHRGAVVAPSGRGRRALVVDPRRERGRRSTRRRSSRRRARSPSRSTASSATRSSSRPTSTRPTLEAAVLASERIQAVLAGRAPLKIIQAGGGKLVNIVVRDVGSLACPRR